MKKIPEILDKLRRTGFKLTPQRLAILEVLQGNTDHPSASMIYQSVRDRYPMISFATVYKTLKVLEKVDEVRPLTIVEDKLNYDPDTSPHHHFHCRACRRIIDVFPSEDPMPSSIDGHQVDKYQVYFYGLCADCAGRKDA